MVDWARNGQKRGFLFIGGRFRARGHSLQLKCDVNELMELLMLGCSSCGETDGSDMEVLIKSQKGSASTSSATPHASLVVVISIFVSICAVEPTNDSEVSTMSSSHTQDTHI